MRIVVLRPEMFVSYQNDIGLALFSNSTYTWFFNEGDLPVKLNTKQVDFLSKDEILEELEENTDLLELAIIHDAAEVQDRDDEDYLNYCLSYD